MKLNRAFTLVELLIAASIFAVVMVSLYAAFATGVFGYRNIEERIGAYQEAINILTFIDKDIRNSLPFSSAEVKFSGSASSVSFFTLVDDYQGSEMTRTLARVSYERNGPGLMRTCRRKQESLSLNPQTKPEEIASGVEDMVFTYLYNDGGALKEKDSWQDLKALPAAVKVKLKIKKKSVYDFERTIYLPCNTATMNDEQ
jgi:type II secretion system protein J